QIELSEGRLHVHRVKNGIPSVHPIRGDEMRALRKLRREYAKEAYVFVSERGGPISPIGFHRLPHRGWGGPPKRLPTRPPSQSTPTCFATPVGSSSRMTATTRGPCSITLGTRTSSTRSGTPRWCPRGSRTFGGDLVRSARDRSRCRRRTHLPFRAGYARCARG